MPPVSATHWGILGYVIFWLLFAIAFGLFAQRAFLLFRLLRLGKGENRFNNIGRRAIYMLVVTLSQWCNLRSVTRKDFAGIGHTFMFYGFCLLVIGYIIDIGLLSGFGLSTVLTGSGFETFEAVYHSILDIAALLVSGAVIWAAIRRYIIKPERLKGEATAEASVILTLVFALMILHVCIVGFGYAAYNVSASHPPIGAALAKFLMGTGISSATLLAIHQGAWWLHYVIILGFMYYIPRSKHLHILASFPNAAFKNFGLKGALKPIDLEQAETFGASKLQDFTWKQLLDLYACTWCGRCHAVCPAHLSGKPLSPRELIINLKEHLLDQGVRLLEARSGVPLSNSGKALIGDVITEDEIWACTTCRACQEVCPVYNEHIDKIIDMRRYLIQVEAKFPEEIIPVFRNVEVYGDTFGMGQSSRLEWAHGLGVEEASEKVQYDALLWLGCEDTFNDRRMQVSRTLVKILQKVGIKFAILGRNEACCGDLARRMGNEYLFQEMVSKNIEALNKFNFKYILTMCPHCYNTLKNEYKHFGGEYEVLHYTELFGRLFEEKKIEFVYPVGAKVIYHDPCYLGRVSGVYEQPRNILKGIKGLDLLEFGRYQENSFCCGAGGGRKWMHEAAGTRVSDIRVEEAMEEAPDTICTTCPYCLEMFEDSVRTLGLEDKIKTLDLIEVMSHAIE